METSHEEILALINDYQGRVKQAVKLLADVIGDDTPPLRALREKKIHRRGELAPGVKYQFHGIGCGVEFPDVFVDFDFGPGGRYDGFDFWRLGYFVEGQEHIYPHFQKKDDLKRAFQAGLDARIFSQLNNTGKNGYLYYLIKD